MVPIFWHQYSTVSSFLLDRRYKIKLFTFRRGRTPYDNRSVRAPTHFIAFQLFSHELCLLLRGGSVDVNRRNIYAKLEERKENVKEKVERQKMERK